jgi:hypothetical protein
MNDRDAQTERPVSTVREEVSGDVALLPDERLNEFRSQWERIQIGFVDRPRESVKAAHDLVDRLAEELVDSFSRQRETLERGWTRGAEDTEELRQSFQRYRSFFKRLLET